MNERSFLVLTAAPREVGRVRRELARFDLDARSLEALLIRHMKAEAARRGADWRVVLQADAAPPASRDWTNLLRVVAAALPAVEAELLGATRTLLLTEPGILARYDRLDLLERLRDRAGSRNGIHGVWVLVPADEQQEMPLVDGKAVPVIGRSQWARVPVAWLENRHRSGAAITTTTAAATAGTTTTAAAKGGTEKGTKKGTKR
jgi:hypothetical protein